jgi:hypothetical protein
MFHSIILRVDNKINSQVLKEEYHSKSIYWIIIKMIKYMNRFNNNKILIIHRCKGKWFLIIHYNNNKIF